MECLRAFRDGLPHAANHEIECEMKQPSTEPIRTTIAFARDLLPLVENGAKIITIRQGRRTFADILNVTDPDGVIQPYRIAVTRQYCALAEDIPLEHLRSDGFSDLADLVGGMQKYYPDFSLGTDCTVVQFRKTS